ncbi:MAG: hypothetical protein ACXW29_05285 [Thermoanaerobaculia bacterium]
MILVTLLLSTVALAKSEKPEPVDHLSAASSLVQWPPTIDHERIALTIIAPDGTSWSKEFPFGKIPSFRLRDMADKPLDGEYAYELRVIPRITGDVKKQLAAARAAGDDAATARIRHAAGLDRTVVQSGTLTVVNGSFINSDAEEPGSGSAGRVPASQSHSATGTTGSPVISHGRIAPLDVVIPDDQIVQGGLCVGLQCVNGEFFGYDTIRLKTSNTRIKFDDTSTAIGFPANDWQLTANDSAGGGANEFSIDDVTNLKTPFTVTGNAPTNSIFVSGIGKVGFGTGAPVRDLHITTGDTPTIRQEQTSASGFVAWTWDIGANEAGWFVRDVTGGSRLPLRIRPGATTSSIDISPDGDVGINTADPNANTKLDVFDSTQLKARISLTGQEFFQAGNTSTEGIAIVLGTNRTGSRQVWFGDTAALAQNSTNRIVRIFPTSGEIASIATDGTPKDLILNLAGGSVGIGTAGPLSKLHVVNGDIRISGGSFIDDNITLNAPDYVFEPRYRLMPIDELAQFVRTERHLPNVPSAADIKAHGLNMSQFQMRLLEKVEELTLYAVVQDEQIGVLKAANQKLEERLAAIEQQLGRKQ